MKLRIGGAVLLLLLVAAVGLYWLRPARPADDAPPAEDWFAEVTDAVRLDFQHDAGDLALYRMPQIVGSGAALFDYDGDGRLDLYLLTNGGPNATATNRLYRNLPDGTFQDVTAGSGLGLAGHNMGVAIGDINNDGRPDVLVTQYGGVKLLLNQGGGKFTDVTEPAGLANPQWATSANFFDYDRDGWLDLVVVNYVDYDPSYGCANPNGGKDYCAPKVFHGTVTRLFHNTGKDAPGAARFEDVTVAAGLARAPGPGLGVYCADFDGDGWPDIFVANDGKPNHLWMNRHNGTFQEEGVVRGIAFDGMAQAQAGMGVAIGDVDNDGRFDVYVTHLGTERHTLWRQGPRRGLFQDATAGAGLLRTAWRGTGFGTLMADFDQDGWLDIAVVNGRVARGPDSAAAAEQVGTHFGPYAERNQLLRNDGTGKFADLSPRNPGLCGRYNVARGLVRGDLDGDGAVDLVVTSIAGRARVYRNGARGRGHWLQVQALDPRLKRDAYGAEVTVVAGPRRWLRLINPGDSFLCSSDPRVHVGLGTAARYDALLVRWPDGLQETFPGGPADRMVVVRRGEGRPS